MRPGGRAAQARDTRRRFISVARELFAAHGYAGTSTEQVLARAGATRGALYHHFASKADLFAAVCEALHAEATAAIEAAVRTTAAAGGDAFASLIAGCNAWLDHMATPESRRLLIIEAPTVLGWERWNDLDRRYGFELLRAGVRAAQQEGSLPPLPTDELAIFLNGAMNQMVLAAGVAGSATSIAPAKAVLQTVLAALRAQAGSPPAQ